MFAGVNTYLSPELSGTAKPVFNVCKLGFEPEDFLVLFFFWGGGTFSSRSTLGGFGIRIGVPSIAWFTKLPWLLLSWAASLITWDRYSLSEEKLRQQSGHFFPFRKTWFCRCVTTFFKHVVDRIWNVFRQTGHWTTSVEPCTWWTFKITHQTMPVLQPFTMN